MAGAARARQGEARAACRCQHDTTGKGGKNGSAAAVLHDLLKTPAGMTLVDLPDGRRVFTPAGADPDAVRRHVTDCGAAS